MCRAAHTHILSPEPRTPNPDHFIVPRGTLRFGGGAASRFVRDWARRRRAWVQNRCEMAGFSVLRGPAGNSGNKRAGRQAPPRFAMVSIPVRGRQATVAALVVTPV